MSLRLSGDLLYGGGGKDQFVIEKGTTVFIEDFSKKDSLLIRGNLNQNKIDIDRNGFDTSIWFKTDLLAEIPRSPFLAVDYFI